jgi:hypothetical protein
MSEPNEQQIVVMAGLDVEIIDADGMTLATRFRISTGALDYRLRCSTLALTKMQEQGDDDLSFILGHWDPDDWLVIDGEPVRRQ